MKTTEKNSLKAVDWYASNRYLYEKLCKEVKEIIEYELDDRKIFFNNIDTRAKELDSFREKCKKDKYKNPVEEICDMAGIRITAYTNSDVDSICEIIEEIFEIDKENSVNKSTEMAVDRFGYLSVHYVAKLDEKYLQINKYKKYENMKFEIQIRTLLQHAWSEIEHDRNYKFKGSLPKELKRRFYMIAGVLEMVDREFESLTKDIETYATQVEDNVSKGLLDMEMTEVSVFKYMSQRFSDIKIENDFDEKVITELKDFGLENVEGLNLLINSIGTENLDKIVQLNEGEYSSTGLVRDFMILNDPDKYFDIWDNNWFARPEDYIYFKHFDIDLSEYVDIDDEDEDDEE